MYFRVFISFLLKKIPTLFFILKNFHELLFLEGKEFSPSLGRNSYRESIRGQV